MNPSMSFLLLAVMASSASVLGFPGYPFGGPGFRHGFWRNPYMGGPFRNRFGPGYGFGYPGVDVNVGVVPVVPAVVPTVVDAGMVDPTMVELPVDPAEEGTNPEVDGSEGNESPNGQPSNNRAVDNSGSSQGNNVDNNQPENENAGQAPNIIVLFPDSNASPDSSRTEEPRETTPSPDESTTKSSTRLIETTEAPSSNTDESSSSSGSTTTTRSTTTRSTTTRSTTTATRDEADPSSADTSSTSSSPSPTWTLPSSSIATSSTRDTTTVSSQSTNSPITLTIASNSSSPVIAVINDLLQATTEDESMQPGKENSGKPSMHRFF